VECKESAGGGGPEKENILTERAGGIPVVVRDETAEADCG